MRKPLVAHPPSFDTEDGVWQGLVSFDWARAAEQKPCGRERRGLPLRPYLGMSSSRRTATPWSFSLLEVFLVRTCICTSDTAPALPLRMPNGCASLRRHARHVGDLIDKGAAIVVEVGRGEPGGTRGGPSCFCCGVVEPLPVGCQNFKTARHALHSSSVLSGYGRAGNPRGAVEVLCHGWTQWPQAGAWPKT